MMEEKDSPGLAELRMTIGSEIAVKLKDFIKRLNEGGRGLDYEDFYGWLESFSEPAQIEAWAELLQWLESTKTYTLGECRECGEKRVVDLHPASYKPFWTRFVRALLSQLRMSAEGLDALSKLGLWRGEREFRPSDEKAVSLSTIYQARARRK